MELSTQCPVGSDACSSDQKMEFFFSRKLPSKCKDLKIIRHNRIVLLDNAVRMYPKVQYGTCPRDSTMQARISIQYTKTVRSFQKYSTYKSIQRIFINGKNTKHSSSNLIYRTHSIFKD